MARTLSVDEFLQNGVANYGEGVFASLLGIYRELEPYMREGDKLGCLAVIAAPDRFVESTQLEGRVGFIGEGLRSRLQEYAGRFMANLNVPNVSHLVTSSDLAYQVRDALGLTGGKEQPVNYPGMFGRKVFTGQPDVGTQPTFDYASRPGLKFN